MTRSTESLIRELAEDLPPVTPIERLRVALLRTLLVFVPVALLWVWANGLRPDLATAVRGPVYLVVAATLVLMTAGGLVAAAADAVPGREAAARRGLAALLVAGAGAVIVFIALVVGSSQGDAIADAASGVPCVAAAAALAIPATIFLTGFIRRGAPASHLRTFVLACAGGVALASGLVHLTCPHPEPLHLVLGHALAPPLAGGVAALGLAAWFGFAARRPETSAGGRPPEASDERGEST